MTVISRIIASDADGIAQAVAALRAGQPVGMPTETVYGLAAPLGDAGALERVFAAKGRPHSDPLIVHVVPALWAGAGAMPAASDAILGMASLGIVDVRGLDEAALAAARNIATQLWPGPLTLVLPRGPQVSDLVTSGLPTVAVRIPRHPVARALIAALGVPLCAPSANRFGKVSPTSAFAVAQELGGRIGLILDGGECEVGLESTVVRVEPRSGHSVVLSVLRPGGLSLERLGDVAGSGVFIRLVTGEVVGDGPAPSPGLQDSHYAPTAPLFRLDSPVTTRDRALLAVDFAGVARRPIGVLVCVGDAAAIERHLALRTGHPVVVRALCENGDEDTAAQRFFGALRELDEAGVERILAEPVPFAGGLWRAIDDRLRRAAGRRPL